MLQSSLRMILFIALGCCWKLFTGLLVFREKKDKFSGIFRVNFVVKLVDFAGLFTLILRDFQG